MLAKYLKETNTLIDEDEMIISNTESLTAEQLKRIKKFI